MTVVIYIDSYLIIWASLIWKTLKSETLHLRYPIPKIQNFGFLKKATEVVSLMKIFFEKKKKNLANLKQFWSHAFQVRNTQPV